MQDLQKFFISLLAPIYERFKAKNPFQASIVLLVLGTVVHTAHQGSFLGIWELKGWLALAVQFVGLFLIAVTGTETYRYLPPDLQAKREALPDNNDTQRSESGSVRFLRGASMLASAARSARFKIEHLGALARARV